MSVMEDLELDIIIKKSISSSTGYGVWEIKDKTAKVLGFIEVNTDDEYVLKFSYVNKGYIKRAVIKCDSFEDAEYLVGRFFCGDDL